MDFKLDKSHLLQQELFRRFAETEIKPLAKEMCNCAVTGNFNHMGSCFS